MVATTLTVSEQHLGSAKATRNLADQIFQIFSAKIAEFQIQHSAKFADSAKLA